MENSQPLENQKLANSKIHRLTLGRNGWNGMVKKIRTLLITTSILVLLFVSFKSGESKMRRVALSIIMQGLSDGIGGQAETTNFLPSCETKEKDVEKVVSILGMMEKSHSSFISSIFNTNNFNLNKISFNKGYDIFNTDIYIATRLTAFLSQYNMSYIEYQRIMALIAVSLDPASAKQKLFVSRLRRRATFEIIASEMKLLDLDRPYYSKAQLGPLVDFIESDEGDALSLDSGISSLWISNYIKTHNIVVNPRYSGVEQFKNE